MSNEKKRRESFVDIAKGFAIIAVVLWHIDYSFDLPSLLPIRTLLGGMWHVPVFFILSGFFLKEEKLLHPIVFIKGKMKTLYVWTLAFYIPATWLHNFFLNIGFYSEKANYGGKTLHLFSWSDFAKKTMEAILFAGREPIVGPLWFAYVLCLALISYSILSAICKKIWKDDYISIRTAICIVIATVSIVLSNKLGITLNRFSNTLVVLSLLALGQYVFQVKRFNFNSKVAFAISLFLAWQSAVLLGNIEVNNNMYQDFFHLFAGSFSMLYVVCFISKKLQAYSIGNVLELIGQKSFYIMALHLLFFEILSLCLIQFGFDIKLYTLSPKTSNLPIILLYLSCGVFGPVIFATAWNSVKNKLVSALFHKNIT